MELQNSIIELLVSNNYISLPGIGSFVQNYQPAKLSPDGTTFLPPKQEISFDPNRSFNDYALESYLCSNHGVETKDSELYVKEFVSKLTFKLEKGETIEFEGIGSLSQNKQGIIEFIPLPDSQRFSLTYGLNPIEVVEVNKPKTAQPIASPTDIKTPYIPTVVPTNEKPRTKFHPALIASLVATTIILIAGVGLYFLLPYNGNNQTTLDKVPASTSESILVTDSEHCAENEVQPDESIDSPQQGTKQSSEELQIASDKRQALFYQEPVQQDEKMYYIIIGSFVNIENAQGLYNTLSNRGLNPEILESDGVYRVAMSKFSDRNRALRELNRIRTESSHDQVWLLGI